MSHSKGNLSTEEVEYLLEAGVGPGQEHATTGGSQQVVTMRGDLEQIHLADIFQTLATAKMEGMLAVHNPIEHRQVFFKNGQVRILVSQRTTNRRIGQRLIAAGMIQGEDLRKALVQQRKSQQPLGAILVKNGFISTDQLEEILAQQIEEELYGLFTWEHGEFEFYRGPISDPATQDRLENCPHFAVNSLLLEVARRADEWEDIIASIGSLDEIPIRVDGFDAQSQPEAHSAVLHAVDGKTSFRSLGDQAMLPLFDCARAARDLVKQGALQCATAEQLLEAAQGHLELGHAKNALMVAHTLRSRCGKQPLHIVRALASLLRACNEGGLACLVALEAAQQQNDPQLALDLAREACSHNPHDLAAMSFLRTTMMAHLPPDSPELATTTLQLLDGLLGDGDADHVLQLVEEIEQLGAKTPAVLLRQARALAKKKEIEHAVSVFVQAAEAFSAAGDRAREIESYELALRLDRNRRDIRKALRQLQMTPRKRLIRVLIGIATLICIGSMGAMWFSARNFAQRLIQANADLQVMLAGRDFQAAHAAMGKWLQELGDCPETDNLAQGIRLAEAKADAEHRAAAHRRAATRLQAAGAALEAGNIGEACAIYSELANNDDLKAEAQEAAEARFRELTRSLEEAGKSLAAQLPPPPQENADQEQLAQPLAYLQQHVREREVRCAREVLQLKAQNRLVVPITEEHCSQLVLAAQTALPLLERGLGLLASYTAVHARHDAQRRLDPLFKAALDHEDQHDFAQALADYQKLLAEKAGNTDLLSHFREKVTTLTAVTEALAAIEAASQSGDTTGARTHFAKLQKLLPKVPFATFVRLPVVVQSSQPGAKVTLNGADIGTTPCLAQVVPAARNELLVSLPRFVPARVELTKEPAASLTVQLTLQHDGEGELGAIVDQPVTMHGDGAAYGVDRNGTVFALDLATRAMRWRHETGDTAGFLSTPIAHEQSLITASLDGSVRALDRTSGKVLWQTEGLATESAPSLAYGRLGVATAEGQLVMLDASKGGITQRTKLTARPAGDLLAADGAWVLPLQNGTVEARHSTTLSVLWQSKAGEMGQALAIAGNRLAALREDGRVSVHDAATGALIWQRDLAGSAVGHLACDRQSLLVTLDDRLVLLDLRDGQERWQTPRTDAGWLGAARMLGTAIAAPLRDGTVLVYSQSSPSPSYRLDGDKKTVSFGIDEQGRVLVFAGRKVASFRSLP